MKIALYKTTGLWPSMVILEERLGRDTSELIRTSEFVDVDFPPRTDAGLVADEIEALDRTIERQKAAIAKLDKEREKLTAPQPAAKPQTIGYSNGGA